MANLHLKSRFSAWFTRLLWLCKYDANQQCLQHTQVWFWTSVCLWEDLAQRYHKSRAANHLSVCLARKPRRKDRILGLVWLVSHRVARKSKQAEAALNTSRPCLCFFFPPAFLRYKRHVKRGEQLCTTQVKRHNTGHRQRETTPKPLYKGPEDERRAPPWDVWAFSAAQSAHASNRQSGNRPQSRGKHNEVTSKFEARTVRERDNSNGAASFFFSSLFLFMLHMTFICSLYKDVVSKWLMPVITIGRPSGTAIKTSAIKTNVKFHFSIWYASIRLELGFRMRTAGDSSTPVNKTTFSGKWTKMFHLKMLNLLQSREFTSHRSTWKPLSSLKINTHSNQSLDDSFETCRGGS